jgi:hypothetical protein
MKKSIFGMIFCCILSVPTSMGQEPGLEDVLSRYYQATGMAEEQNWETLVMTGKTMNSDAEYPYKVTIKRPGRIRTEFEIQGTRSIRVWDGKKGWSVVPWGGSLEPQDMTEDDAKDLREEADMEGALYHWKEKGFEVRLVGRDDLEGTPVYNIELKKPSGDKENYYIGTETFLLLKVAFHVLVMGHVQEHEEYLTNYRKVEGVYLPFTVMMKYTGSDQQGGNQYVYDQIRVNEPVSDTLFVKPVHN